MTAPILTEQPAFHWGQTVPATAGPDHLIFKKEGTVMNKLLMAAVALTALATTPAVAAGADSPQSATFGVDASVNASCSAITGANISIGQIAVNSSGHLVDPGQINGTAQPAYCNGLNSYISIAPTAMMTNSTPTSAEFTNRIDYDASLTIGGGTSWPFDASGGTDPASVGGTGYRAFAGDLTIILTRVHTIGDLRPLAGDYHGEVVVTLTPGV